MWEQGCLRVGTRVCVDVGARVCIDVFAGMFVEAANMQSKYI